MGSSAPDLSMLAQSTISIQNLSESLVTHCGVVRLFSIMLRKLRIGTLRAWRNEVPASGSHVANRGHPVLDFEDRLRTSWIPTPIGSNDAQPCSVCANC